MVTWGGGGNSSPLVKFRLETSKLEYGKGKELEDESRSSRLFDKEDGGAGTKRGGGDDDNNDNKNSDNRRGMSTTNPAIERDKRDVDVAGKRGNVRGWHCFVYCWFAKLNNYFILY
jgi:hypothetical protein